MTTFATRIAQESVRVNVFAVVQGLPSILSEFDGVPSSIAGSRTVSACIMRENGIEQGESQIDLNARRMTGASLTLKMADDATLRALFKPRAREAGQLANDTDKTSTTLTLASTALLATSGVVYIDGETITYTGKTATTLTGCTRGAYGSKAERHKGSATDAGALVYDVPPYWTGRRVSLYAAVMKRDGTTTANLCSVMQTFVISSAPKFDSNKIWTLECRDICDEFANRKIFVGFPEITPDAQGVFPPGATVSNPDDIASPVTSSIDSWPVNSYPTSTRAPMTCVIAKGSGSWRRGLPDDAESSAVAYYQGTTSVLSLELVKLSPSPYLVATNAKSEIPYRVDTLQMCVVLRGSIGNRIVELLTSEIGNGDNGSYDVLPGIQDPVSTVVIARFGAAFDASDIDISAFLTVGSSVPVTSWSACISETMTVAELLEDFCRLTDSVWLVTPAGVLTVKKLRYETATSVGDVSDTIAFTDAVVEYNEDSITPYISLQLGYDPIQKKHLHNVRILDQDLAARYPQNSELAEIKTRFLHLSTVAAGALYQAPGCVSPTEVETMLRRWQRSSSRGDLFVSVKCPISKISLALGDTVSFTDANLVDMEGGTMDGKIARIIGKRIEWDSGTVSLRLFVFEPLRVIAPSASIDSVVGTTLNLSATSRENYAQDSAKPARQFRAGWKIWVQDLATSARQMRTISSITSDTALVLDSAPTVTPTHITVYARDLDTSTGAPALVSFTHVDYSFCEPADVVGECSRWR